MSGSGQKFVIDSSALLPIVTTVQSTVQPPTGNDAPPPYAPPSTDDAPLIYVQPSFVQPSHPSSEPPSYQSSQQQEEGSTNGKDKEKKEVVATAGKDKLAQAPEMKRSDSENSGGCSCSGADCNCCCYDRYCCWYAPDQQQALLPNQACCSSCGDCFCSVCHALGKGLECCCKGSCELASKCCHLIPQCCEGCGQVACCCLQGLGHCLGAFLR